MPTVWKTAAAHFRLLIFHIFWIKNPAISHIASESVASLAQYWSFQW